MTTTNQPSRYPLIHTAESGIPERQVEFVCELTAMLLAGEDLTLEVLRTQLVGSRVERLEWTGVGFFAEFLVPDDLRLSDRRNMAGGNAFLTVENLPHGAGCVLFVRDGLLDFLEGYVYGEGEWGEDAEIISIRDVEPILSNSGSGGEARTEESDSGDAG